MKIARYTVRREMEYLKVQCIFDSRKRTNEYNTRICCALLLFICGGTLLLEMILLTVSFILKCRKAFVIVETVLSSISAVALFCTTVSLASFVDPIRYELWAYCCYYYLPSQIRIPAQATAAFGFLAAFAISGLIYSLWVKLYLEKKQAI